MTSLILKSAEFANKYAFLAALDVPFDDNGNILSNDAQEYIFGVTEDEGSEESVLFNAINNDNTEIIEYLTIHCWHIIQELEHAL